MTPALIPTSGMLRTWVDLYGPTTEAPDEAHLAAAIALVSAAIGWKFWIQWAENSEPCTVNVLLEGRSATARKTTVAATAHSLARASMAQIGKKDQRLGVRNLSHVSERGLLEAVATKDAEKAEEWETNLPPGMLFVWDEFGSVLGRPGDTKGADWLGRVRTTIMALTNGRHGGTQTGQERFQPSRCAVSFLATMTRIELEQRASAGLLRDGFLGRFILIPYSGRRGWLAEPPKWTAGMVQQKDSLVAWLNALAQSSESIGHVFDKMTPEAKARRAEWYETRGKELEAIAEETHNDSDIGASEAFGRLQTTALKVAAVAAVADWSPPDSLRNVTITLEHVEYGIYLAELALAEVSSLGAESEDGPADRFATKVCDYLEAHGHVTQETAISKDTLMRKVKLNGMSRGDRWKVIEGLHPETIDMAACPSAGRKRLDVWSASPYDERKAEYAG